MYKFFDKVIQYILNILLVIVVVILIIVSYYMFQIKIMSKDYANIFGYTFFYVVTGSMSPTINEGDVVIVKITKEVNTDEIIVYKDGGNFITHRLLEIKDEQLLTKGDANNSPDKWGSKDAVVGKVIKIIPNISVIKKAILSPQVFIPGVITLILFLLAFSYSGKDKESV